MKYLFLIATTIFLSGCVKDKLKNESAILIGSWVWDHSIEYTFDVPSNSEVETIIPASNYPGTYALTFKKSGKVSTAIDGVGIQEFRIILDVFRLGTCDLQGGYEYKINLDNVETDTIVGCVNSDTLTSSDVHLPISKGSSQYPYYKHVFVK